ncbi:ThiF family adenylyltransferase [Pseudohoeflea coraliihabitans]|uniref:ThiF family adenylyltransferase n=1 Tax=Pseudohoeflea coraliihabitans TaxID=2860393 RepID=A0ABS6WS75_9HYPH|nr:ThiF family adenylyltransferase [Pseudohoeflea sp. DP4N28-3]MBW3098814.1 ThiF family adenylyltransferase [Pseudohoeflea sp. DP4N28-3]
MAEGLSLQRKLALAAVDAALASYGERVDGGTLRRTYPARATAAGWRIPVNFPDQLRRMDLLAENGFPWTPPKIALVDRPPFLTWPHVEEDGILCFLPSGASVDSSRPADTARALLGEACEMVQKLAAGEMGEDFESEFISYWGRSSDDALVPVYSLCATDGESRVIYCWRGARFTLLADTREELEKWLRNRLSTKRDASFSIEPALLVALDHPPRPSQYPRSGAELAGFIEQADPDAADALRQLLQGLPQRFIAAFCARTVNGPAFACVSVDRPEAPRWPGGRGGDPISKGFRPGNVPPELRLNRFLGGQTAKRPVERADPSWVHGRDQDPDAGSLRERIVVCVGCGSLGAPVVEFLARAGVGKLILIDPETLRWANVGRHILGASDVGERKAVALAHRLRTDLPHIDVEALPFRLEQVLRDRSEHLSEADLIISTTGDWGPESLLNDWHSAIGRSMPVIYGWAEPHACAGHALAIAGKGGCLRCGFDAKGRYQFEITGWANPTEVQEPGCGAVFQPYGPVAMSNIASRVAELGIEFLVGSARTSMARTWVGRPARIRGLGGEITPHGLHLLAGRPEGEFVCEEPWPDQCANCSVRAVA